MNPSGNLSNNCQNNNNVMIASWEEVPQHKELEACLKNLTRFFQIFRYSNQPKYAAKHTDSEFLIFLAKFSLQKCETVKNFSITTAIETKNSRGTITVFILANVSLWKPLNSLMSW